MAQPLNHDNTTDTKIFVGGLAWETKRDAMRAYFEQFGEIIEAVVITDRLSGRSKGYGFVTFKEIEAARKACLNPTPVIDGRRANCNLASLGQKHRPQHAQGPRSHYPGGGFVSPAPPPYSTYPPQQFGYSPYGYAPPYPEGYGYPQGMYPAAAYGMQPYGQHAGMYGSPGGLQPGVSGPYAPFPAYSQANPGYSGPLATLSPGLPVQFGGQIPLPSLIQPAPDTSGRGGPQHFPGPSYGQPQQQPHADALPSADQLQQQLQQLRLQQHPHQQQQQPYYGPGGSMSSEHHPP